MSCYSNLLKKLPEFARTQQAIEQARLPLAVTGLSHIHKAHWIHSFYETTGLRSLVLTPDESTAHRIAADLNVMREDSAIPPAFVYVPRDFSLHNIEGISREYEHQRLRVLSQMLSGEYSAVVCPVEAAVQFTIPPEILLERTLTLRQGDTLSPQSCVATLLSAGYLRSEQVEGVGQFALRGGILDFFTPNYELPIRIEFWGDSIDTIASFSTEDQRRVDQLEEVCITPAMEIIFSDTTQLADRLEDFLSRLKGRSAQVRKHLRQDLDKLENGVSLSSADRYYSLIYPRSASLFDYAEDALLFLCDSANAEERLKSAQSNQLEEFKSLFEQGLICPGLDQFSLDQTQLFSRLEDQGVVCLDNFTRGSYGFPLRQLENVTAGQLSSWSGSLRHLTDDLESSGAVNDTVVILAGTPKAAWTLHQDLLDAGYSNLFHKTPPASFEEKALTVLSGSLSSGFSYPTLHLQLISYSGHKGAASSKTSRRKRSGEKFNSLEELKKGDYVVHAAHGIGVFDGIQKMEVEGLTKDYVKIRYAQDDVLYTPVTQLDLVSKYIGGGSGEGSVRLHRLGGQQWNKTRSKVRSAVKDMAKELIALYQKRLNLQGYTFMPDTDMQRDFEDRFEFDETDDQLRCVREIKRDMEHSFPMDRLLCGDVGFGKTEVALRAAFKCIAEGKQCAILVPTTILALQHYQTLQRRMEGFPIEVDMLSRFRSAKEQKEIMQRLKNGTLDVVVGTHKLFSKELQFRDLGLLIVDEEQRFGVGQKEKLKALFPNVDALTLSATPIPRTLNMAMSGIRDMSLLEEAPQDRHPVQTYVIEYDFGVVIDAIGRELRRGGQVYYLRNKIEGIEHSALKIQQEFPNAVVSVAHGAMTEDQLGEIWRRLMEGEIDVLVCTTIIETGVDVSNVNTLIVENADHMGLAQLHQLRGRVGRSSRRAFAYLTYHRGKVISEIATRRLEAIREFTEFGAGMKIAMRDLEIRGAGNILGAQQHGHMADVGYDLYLKMLNEAVREEKGEKFDGPEKECLIDLQIQAHIPESYIESLPQRLAIYRRIAEIRSNTDAEDVYDELIDRFGDVPSEVQGLVEISLLRNLAAASDVYEITQQRDALLLKLNQLNMETVAQMAGILGRRMTLSANSTPPVISVQLLPGQSPIEGLRQTFGALSSPPEHAGS